jgi:hypothetical protein
VEQTSFFTDHEIEWVKVIMKNNKELLVGSFYMPLREQKHLDELSKSLEKIENHNITNIVLTGDFNCPDIRWDTQTACGPDREIQQGLADLMGANYLTQIHDSGKQPVRPSICIKSNTCKIICKCSWNIRS